MIAKCIAILAVVAQINAAICNQDAVVLSSCGSSCGSSVSGVSGVVSGVSDAGLAGGLVSGSTGGAITRNIVAKGKYPVALRNCGPTPDRQIPVTTSRVTAPVQEKPTVRLPCNIPAPRTVSHCCTCYKTILRPRVHQQIITVPTVQRFLQTTHRPVVENIQYEAVPVNCDDSSCNGQVQFVSGSLGGVASAGCGCAQGIEIPSVGCASSCGSVQSVQVPTVGCASSCGSVPTFEIPSCAQNVAPVQTIQFPSVGCSSVPTVEIPSVGCASSCGSVQFPSVGCAQSVGCGSVQVPQLPAFDCQQTVQIPQVQSCQTPVFQVENVQPCFSSCNTC